MMVRAVFFDLFETLVTEFVEGSRISKRNYNYLDRLGLSNEQFKQEWRNRHRGRMTGEFPDYPAVIKDILDKREIRYNKEVVQQLYRDRIREKMLPFQTIRHDIIHLLTDIKQRGIKLGLISNCTEEEVRGWQQSELAAYFDDVIFSYEVGLAKPDKTIYILGCERLSVEPGQSAFVGDGGSRELEGAYGAGLTPCHALWFNRSIHSGFKKIDAPLAVKEWLVNL